MQVGGMWLSSLYNVCVCVGNGGVIGKTEILRRSVRLERKARMNVSPKGRLDFRNFVDAWVSMRVKDLLMYFKLVVFSFEI